MDGWEAFEALYRLELKEALAVVKLRPGHAALAAGVADIVQRFGEVERTQALMRDFVLWVLAHAALPSQSDRIAPPSQESDLAVTDEA